MSDKSIPMNPSSSGSGKKARILLVEDHIVVRQGIAQLINQQPDLMVCGEADTVPKALDAVAATKPDVAVVDLTLKSGDGLELLKNITAVHPEILTLVVSMHDESLYAELALHAGAKGYVMKDEAIDEVLNAIRQILRGKIYLSDAMVTQLLQAKTRGPAASSVSPVERLSERELQVFQLIGQWYRTRDIAEKLNLSIKTVEYYRDKIKEKLNLKNATALTQFATEWVQKKNS